MSNQNDILRSIIADPASTDGERLAAQKQLGGSHVSEECQDNELETYLLARNGLGTLERLDLRRRLSPSTQQLLNDFDACRLLVVTDPSTEHRLQSLLDKTSSDVVRQEVIPALATIAWLKQTGKLKYANPA